MVKFVTKVSCLFLLMVVATGCSVYHIESQNTTPDYFPPKVSSQQVVYLEKIDRPYDVVGVVSVSADNGRPLSEVLEQMRDQAALLGGDVITALSSEAQGSLRKRFTAKVAVFQ